jgi:hypothetical protein
MRRIAIVFTTVVVSLAISAQVAFADSCTNFSRAAPTPTGPGPIIKGNWVWLPSVGAPIDGWGFAPPGAFFSTTVPFPGAAGNYTDGATSSLLGVSAICSPGGVPNRQTTHGIQSGCE